MKPQLIVALDLSSADLIPPVVDGIGDAVDIYKVGLELFCAAGPAVLKPLRDRRKAIFLDLKLHDIPRTVARAVRTAASHGVSLLTLHASGGQAMLSEAVAAVKEMGDCAPKLLAVTVLTSLDGSDLERLGIARSPQEQVLRLAEMAAECGIPGVVASPGEAAAIRQRLGPDFLIVTPGIRPADDAAGDQKRIGTPEAAVRAGATHLVVGRPIVEAADPAGAARQIRAAMESAQMG